MNQNLFKERKINMDKKFIINAPEESYICPPVFDEDFPKLSLSAIGILGQMMNVPELDYCTIP